MVAGTCIEWLFRQKPDAKVLVVALSRDLVDQLERALWRHISKYVPTQQLTGTEKPDYLDGVTCATIQSAIVNLRHGWRPDFIFIDEAHHLGEQGQLSEMMDLCDEALILGATATPWRGDTGDIEARFGGTSYKLGIEEGMRLGYLCDVLYRVFSDNIDWEFVRDASSKRYSLKELNTRLFMPQRDERIRDELIAAWNSTRDPRAIVFCQSIEHAERMHRTLATVPCWFNAQVMHAQVPKRQRQMHMMSFRTGQVPLLVAVDVLNEGVDIPDVNRKCTYQHLILLFLRINVLKALWRNGCRTQLTLILPQTKLL
jgi:superfamily II DNA or RNA helicase